MVKFILSTIFVMLFIIETNAQNIVKGIVIDNNTEKPLVNVLIHVKNTIINKKTQLNGVFIIDKLPNGKYLLEISINGYETQVFPIQLNGKPINLGTIYLFKDITDDQDLSIITITDDELNDDASAADNISGLLQ